MADDSNLFDGQSHAGRAGELEKDAADRITTLVDGPQDVRNPGAEAYAMTAQASATLALSHRIAALTAALGDYLGDDSHLDGIKREIRDGLEGIRADGVGVG